MKSWAKQTAPAPARIQPSDFTQAQFSLIQDMHRNLDACVGRYLVKAVVEHPESQGRPSNELSLRTTYLTQFYGNVFSKAIESVFDVTDLQTQEQLTQRFEASKTYLDVLIHQHYEAITQEHPEVAAVQSQHDYLSVGHDFYQRVFSYMKTAVRLQQVVSSDKAMMH